MFYTGLSSQSSNYRYIWGEFRVFLSFYESTRLISPAKLDRQVKIWPVRVASSPEEIKREDKPLFSSGRVHKARVLSISW